MNIIPGYMLPKWLTFSPRGHLRRRLRVWADPSPPPPICGRRTATGNSRVSCCSCEMLRCDLVLPASRLSRLFFNAGDEYVVRNVVINLISLTKNYHEGRPPVPLPLCPPRPSVGGRLAAKAAREGILWGGSKAERGERENKT